LSLLLDRASTARLPIDPSGVALRAAVESHNTAAAVALLRAGANPLGGRICALVVALFRDRNILRTMLDEAADADFGGARVNITEFFLGPNWDEDTLAAVGTGGTELRRIVDLRGFTELAKFVRDLEAEPKDERKTLELDDPTGGELFL
jgi:hypothetical protein